MGHSLSWTMGRQLASFDDISYTYNEDGIRTSKTVDNVTTTYFLDETNIIEQIAGNTVLHFYYDNNDEVIGFEYNSNNYYYVKNAMSDIVGIVDSDGNLVASYTYDPWGKVLSVTGSNTEIGNLNPFRYRSYYYDSDIQMYYLQSRYYDPEVCRFINCDDVNYIGITQTELSYNAFAYCENDSVNDCDPSGNVSKDSIIKVLKKVLDKILSFSQNVVNFILDNFSISTKKYIKMSSNGKTPKSIYTFVRNNKSSIKSLRNNFSSIGKFLKIVIEITDLTAILSKNVSYAKAVAEILFDGFIKLFTFCASKFGSWLITTICKPLKIIKSFIDDILSFVIEELFDRSNRISYIKSTYLKYVDCKRISFSNYIYALFKGVCECV